MQKKFLITGITGFAGPHLANLLHHHGHKVYGLIRGTNGMETDILDVVPDSVYKDITFLHADLNNHRLLEQVFKENKFDGVFHLAAQSHPPSSFTDPLGTFQDNIMGSANLIQAISDHQPDCMLMFCSTSEVYGNSGSDGHVIKVTEKLAPSNPYGTSKAAIDLYMQERIANGKLRGFITRAFSHTGPRRGKNFSISSDAYQLARIMKGHEPTTMLYVGNLESVRVVIDVRDTVNAYYLAMMHPDVNGEIFNVCGSTPRKMGFFTDQLIELSGRSVVKVISKDLFRPIDIHYQDGDSWNLYDLTGWKPEYPIKETLHDLLDYWYNKLN